MADEKKVRGQIHFRITPEEAAIIEGKAAEVGLSPTMYSKKQALEGKVKAPVLGKEAAAVLLPQMSKIGTNVNQIARSLNMGAAVAPEAIEDIKDQLQQLLEQVWAAILDGKKPKNQDKQAEQTVMKEEKPSEISFSSPSDDRRTCSKCGEVLERKHSSKQNKDYWICPRYSQDEKGHAFEWVE